MDVTQARELYSAYYEGTIERVSAVALDEAMTANEEIREDYASFAAIMDALPTLSEEKVAMPHDLHDRIMAKLDRADWEKRDEKKLFLFVNPKMAWFGTAAAALIAFAVIAVMQARAGGSAGGDVANPGPVSSTPVSVSFTVANGTIQLTATGPLASSVVVSSPGTGVQPTVYNTSTGAVNVPLRNDSTDPSVVEVTGMIGKSRKETSVIVLPGTVRVAKLTGNGTVLDCAKAIAATYGAPVQVEGDATKQCRWALTNHDTSDKLVVALGRTNIDARLSSSNILQISAP